MKLGSIMLDMQGLSLTAEEREILLHPQVGGVILFSRNYESIEQLRQLTQQIHQLREPRLLIAVDHEGGRVQRFQDAFSTIPAAAALGQLYEVDSYAAISAAEQVAWLLATELLCCGVDFSFTPVLDLDYGISTVIGDRALHKNPEVVAKLGTAILKGLQKAGMAAVGKHFPGHGGVQEDSHLAKPIDNRDLEALMQSDLIPFITLIKNGLAGIMPAHVIYSELDDKPSGYSKFWLQNILRDQLHFNGVIFSDDLSMNAANIGNTYPERALLALEAGCDMVLVCNKPEAAIEIIESLESYSNAQSAARLENMRSRNKHAISFSQLQHQAQWQQAQGVVKRLSKNFSTENIV